jgi:hypothetical protein
MPDADEKAPEVVGECVQRPYRVAYLGVRVRAPVADVVGDRVDDEEADASKFDGEIAERLDVAGKLDVPLDGEAAVDVGACGDKARLEVDLDGVFA